MDILLLTAALGGWMCSLYLVLILMEKRSRERMKNTDDQITQTLEAISAQTEQNMKHLEAITECIEEMNKNWEEQVREYCNR